MGIVDIHAHVWLGQVREDAASLLRGMDYYGVEKMLLSGLGSLDPEPEEINLLNSQVAALIREESRFGGYVHVNARHANAMDVLTRGLEEQGMWGMKIWVSTLCDDPAWDRLYDLCAQYHAPVLVHTFEKTVGQLAGESTALHLRRAALRHPETCFILAHLGGNCYTGVPAVADIKNIWADFSGSTCRGDDLPYALERMGEDRLLFGSDGPGSFSSSLGQVLEIPCARVREKLLEGNARRLFPGLRGIRDGNAV